MARLGHGGQINFVSSDFSTNWSLAQGVVVTAGIADPMGGTKAILAVDSQTTQAALIQTSANAIKYAADGTKVISIWLKQESATTIAATVKVRDGTAAADRAAMSVTWPSSNSPAITATAGSILGIPEAWPGNWWRSWCDAPGVVAANDNRFQIFCAGGTAGNVGDLNIFFPFTSDAAEPYRYVPAQGSTTSASYPPDTISDHPPYADVPWAVPPTVAPPFTRRP